jgi:hypothetical protein
MSGLARLEDLEFTLEPVILPAPRHRREVSRAARTIHRGVLRLLLGEDWAPGLAALGCERVLVNGRFHVASDHRAVLRLREHGIRIDADGDGSAIRIRRRVSGCGRRSESWINGTGVASAVLREVGLELLDVPRELVERVGGWEVFERRVEALMSRREN